MSARNLSSKARPTRRIKAAFKITPQQWEAIVDCIQIIKSNMEILFPAPAPGRGKKMLSMTENQRFDFVNAVHCSAVGDVSEELEDEFKNAIKTCNVDFFKIMILAMEHRKQTQHTQFSKSLAAARRARITLKKDGVYPTKDAIKKHVIKLHGSKVFSITQQSRWSEVFAELPSTKKAQGIKPRSRQAQTKRKV